MSHLDNLLESENENDDDDDVDDDDEGASETTSQASDINSTDSAQQRLRAFSSPSSRMTSTHGPLPSNSSLSSTNIRVDLNEPLTHENGPRNHGIFSRSSSPIMIDSSSEDNGSPFTSKVSIVESTNRVLNNELTNSQVGSTSIQQNKRQTTFTNSEVPAKRITRETEIW